MKKMTIINVLGIISLVFIVFSIVITIIAAIVGNSNSAYAIVTTISLIMGLVGAILSMVGALLILTRDFQSKELYDARILWGVLSLIIIGPIGILIFIKKYQGKAIEESIRMQVSSGETYGSNSHSNNGLSNIEKASEMLSKGLITKEEFEEIKRKNL